MTWVPPPKRSVELAAALKVPLLVPPALSESVPLLTETVPLLLNGTFMLAVPVPTVRVTIPELLKAFVPPKFSKLVSARASKVAPALLLNVPPMMSIRVPVHTAEPLLTRIRFKPLVLPSILRFDEAPKMVVPVSPIAPPDQVATPLTLSVPAPPMLPLVKFKRLVAALLPKLADPPEMLVVPVTL